MEKETIPSNKNFQRLNWDMRLNQQQSITRERLEAKEARLIQLSNALTHEQCQYIIHESEKLGFSKIDNEYPKEYRDNRRLLAQSDDFADHLWQTLFPVIKEDLENARPFGITTHHPGAWIPTHLNPIFRICKYLPGGKFSPHFDGSHVEFENQRSIFTLMIYLNNDFTGGETEFLQSTQRLVDFKGGKIDATKTKVIKQVRPQEGAALIFNHDVLHQGVAVKKGIKYVLRTDIIFRFDGLIDLAEAEREEKEKKVEDYYLQSDAFEAAHLVEKSTEAYLQGLEAQTNGPCFSVRNEEADEDRPLHINDLPDELLLGIFMRVGDFRTSVHLSRVCVRWLMVSRDNRLWREHYRKKAPLTVAIETRLAWNTNFLERLATDHARQREVPNFPSSLKGDRVKKSKWWKSHNLSGYNARFIIMFLDNDFSKTKWIGEKEVKEFETVSAVVRSYGHNGMIERVKYGAHMGTWHKEPFSHNHPLQRGLITDWHCWAGIVNSVWEVKKTSSTKQGLLYVHPPTSPAEDRIGMLRQLFVKFKVPMVAMVDAATVSVFSSGKISGLSLAANLHLTTLSVVQRGEVLAVHSFASLASKPEGAMKEIAQTLSIISEHFPPETVANIVYYGSLQSNVKKSFPWNLLTMRNKNNIELELVDPMIGAQALGLCHEFRERFMISLDRFAAEAKQDQHKLLTETYGFQHIPVVTTTIPMRMRTQITEEKHSKHSSCPTQRI